MVSVLLPCYRLDAWLFSCLESIDYALDGVPGECIVVVNNLTTDEITVIKNYTKKNLKSVFKIVDAGVTNLSGALNFGLKYCEYELIARMDQDDLMKKNRLSLQATFLNRNPRVLLVGGATEIISSSGEKIKILKYPDKSYLIKKNLKYSNCIAHPAVMFRKSSVMSVGGYDAFYEGAEDFELYKRLIRLGRIRNIRDTVISYRVSNEQTSKIRSEQQIAATCAVLINEMFEKNKTEILFREYIQDVSLVDYIKPAIIFEELPNPCTGVFREQFHTRVKICKFRMNTFGMNKTTRLVVFFKLFRRNSLFTLMEVINILILKLIIRQH
jgi:glycosyltransferase involved in cell wall biosynthesis